MQKQQQKASSTALVKGNRRGASAGRWSRHSRAGGPEQLGVCAAIHLADHATTGLSS